MIAIRKRRIFTLLFLLLGVSLALALSLYALKQNINLFYTPSQVVRGDAPIDTTFRVGGMVQNVEHGQGLKVQFAITDTAEALKVHYEGILPDLFKVGQGVVVEGRLSPQGEFIAQEVLAKHDERYMPPEVKTAIAKAKRKHAA